MEVTFLGAAGTVTGSKFLVRSGTTRVLVDCGLFQGLKELRQRNWRPLPFDPGDLDAVVLSHAHLDHTGFLPALIRDGYDGPVHCTLPTRDLCTILLADSGRIQEEDAEYANRKGFSKHSPALPLYTSEDAERAIGRLAPVAMRQDFSIGQLSFTYHPAGHILGAASVRVQAGAKAVLFSGDLGRSDDLLMPVPDLPGSPDWVVMESTYGDRDHPKGDPIEALGEVAKRTLERGGVLIIPSFAVGRAQTMIYCFHRLFETGQVERVPVFLNSPMAIDVSELYHLHHSFHKLTLEQCARAFRDVRFVHSVSQSKALNRRKGPMVIIAAAGMLTGGRVLHHLKTFGGDPRSTILLPGYQAEGTRGAALLRGEEQLKIHGRYWPIRAEVIQHNIFSAHGDQGDLVSWIGECERPPRGVALVHGEPDAARTLTGRIGETLGYDARPARDGETVIFD
jgi:metallo-beta-lactamase family protein